MNKLIILSTALLLSVFASAQPDDAKNLQQTARSFMQTGDFNNAIIVLNRALQTDKNNLELLKDLAMTYYLKQDYTKSYEVVKQIVDRDDADVQVYQIAGNVYRAIEMVKECDKMYKKALKKFPNSGPLYSEYGELLWQKKDFAAINYWEKGIELDPAYGGNYYNAATFYFYTKDKVWSLIYGEIFANMESLSERGAAMKELLYKTYKEKLFADADILKGEEKNKNEFSKAFLNTMSKEAGMAANGVNTEVLTMIRTKFILDWFDTYAGKFPFKLFDFQQQLIKEGLFDAYNQWLFGSVENLAAYESWTKTHEEVYNKFKTFQKSRIFKMPVGQHYQGK
ncbi:MAG: tetratricopeptide repeat protein [Chitinophagaceae bacterium]|nr:tetratricopeptide repeat protein [Chitinophagaceae bacterium]